MEPFCVYRAEKRALGICYGRFVFTITSTCPKICVRDVWLYIPGFFNEEYVRAYKSILRLLVSDTSLQNHILEYIAIPARYSIIEEAHFDNRVLLQIDKIKPHEFNDRRDVYNAPSFVIPFYESSDVYQHRDDNRKSDDYKFKVEIEIKLRAGFETRLTQKDFENIQLYYKIKWYRNIPYPYRFY